MFTYTTMGNGFTITIRDDKGRECFMQGDDAAQLVDELDRCETDEQEQMILSQYEHVME